MLEFFPDAITGPNYWANHHFTMAVNCGVSVGDAVHAFGPALAVSRTGKDATSREFRQAIYDGMNATANWLEDKAAEDIGARNLRSAGDKLLRAATIYELADWYFWPWSSPDPRLAGELFRRARHSFLRGVEFADPTAHLVQIPFEGHNLPGVFVPAIGISKKAPVTIHLNGQHSSLHWHYLIGLPRLLAERGVASLLFDHPGVGAARYDLGLKVRADTETYVAAAISFLERGALVDGDRVGAIGGSLGGYRAPRAAAFEPRIKAAVVWGAHYDMYDSIRIDWPEIGWKLPRGGPFTEEEQKVVDGLHYWTGTCDLHGLDLAIRALSLEGILDRLRVPLLVLHGAEDAQLPAWHARRTVSEAVNSPEAKLVLFDELTGGKQHCNWDNPKNALCMMADWLAHKLS